MSSGLWAIIDDFDAHSINGGVCPITGTIKQKDDPGVFRGAYVDDRGMIDLSYFAVRELIQTADGLPKEDADRLKEELAALRKLNEELFHENDWLRGLIEQIELAKKEPRKQRVTKSG